MITIQLARELATAGLSWSPTSGDRFVVPNRDMDNEVFHVAEMTIEVHTHHGAGVVKFNGTTEWALDSIPASSVLWLPREDQLRTSLGTAFVALDHEDPNWVVSYLSHGQVNRVRDADAECAYARALLAVIAAR